MTTPDPFKQRVSQRDSAVMSGQSRKLAQSQIWHILLLYRISETALSTAESAYQTADRGDGKCINPILVTLEEVGG